MHCAQIAGYPGRQQASVGEMSRHDLLTGAERPARPGAEVLRRDYARSGPPGLGDRPEAGDRLDPGREQEILGKI